MSERKIKYIQIIFSLISSIILFIFWKFWGLILGFIFGYLIFFIITYIIQIINGGVIPRKERKRVAKNYLSNFKKITNLIYPNKKNPFILKKIEKIIEEIFRKSIFINPSEEEKFKKIDIGKATMDLVKSKESTNIRRLYKTVYLQIINDLYPDAKPDMVFPEINFINNIKNISVPYKWLYYIPSNLKPSISKIDSLEELRLANAIENDKFSQKILSSNALTHKVQISHYKKLKEDTFLSDKEILRDIFHTRVFGANSWGWSEEKFENAMKKIDSIESLISMIIKFENEIDSYTSNPILKKIDDIIGY